MAAALTLGAVGATAVGAAPQPDPATNATSAAAPFAHRVIVQWADGTDHSERVTAREGAGVAYDAMLGDPSFQLVVTQDGESAAAAAAALEEDPAVAVAEPDSMRSVEAIPNDPLFGEEWGLRNTGQTVNGLVGKSGNDINVVSAWNRTIGTPNIVVADIDTGYRADSPDLGPVLWTNPGELGGNGVDDDGDGFIDDVHGWDFVGENVNSPTPDADPTDSNLVSGGHGVHTAGTIGAAGNNGTGIGGVAQNVRIMPLRVCSNQPTDSEGHPVNEVRCATSAIIAAINYAGLKGARVANLSLGGTVFSQAEANAFAANPGTLYVISAGNDSANDDSGETAPHGHHYPCDYRPTVDASPPSAVENIICVAALASNETLASYSDYGTTSVDLAAPGSSVLSTFPATETLFSDNFETNNFATQWTTFGSGFARSNESPLTSFGMTDSPGATASANHIYGVKATTGVAVPAGTGACRVEGQRSRNGGGSSGAPYGVIEDGSTYLEYFGGETGGSAMVSFRTVPITGLGGHSVQPFFEYRATAAPGANDGLWLDEVALRCNAPLTVPPTYSFLDGTSMAAPHVSGAAALLFSLKPGATVTEVRNAILGHTTAVAGLAGKTTTGGRLNVSAALDALVPPGTETTAPDTALTSTPPASTSNHRAAFHARRLDADGGSFECRLDAGAFAPCSAEPIFHVASGSHMLEVRAKNEADKVDLTPASFTWVVDNTDNVAPAVTVTEGPTGLISVTGATLKFTATDSSGPVTTECSLDGAPFAACTSPKTYASLADGIHEFEVQGEDAFGNVTSAIRSWTVDTLPPSLAITEGPAGATTATTAIFKFSATDPHGPVTTECSLDGAAFAACTSPTTYASLGVGGHEFKLRAADALGNIASASRGWTIEASSSGGGSESPGFFKAAEELMIKANPAAQPEAPPAVVCHVPRLVGKTLRQAKAALAAAGCTLGKVTSPKIAPGAKRPKLAVKSTTPAAGSGTTTGVVDLLLGAKPKKHRHH